MFKRKPKSFRSGLEESILKDLAAVGVNDCYETIKIPYLVPETNRTYTPDFVLPNGIIIESKGMFPTEDRQKMKLVKEQNPELDIRMVFSNPNAKIYKGSPTSHAKWCETHGFKWAKKTIPLEWIQEKGTGTDVLLGFYRYPQAVIDVEPITIEWFTTQVCPSCHYDLKEDRKRLLGSEAWQHRTGCPNCHHSFVD